MRPNFLTYDYFLIPYAIIQGVMGGIIGWYAAKHLLERKSHKMTPNQITI
ncbi:MAG: hypothetical protein HWN80_02865 [Candidatus Lokiarchaeota archaeon]|nr:hypothetical protein [Candidatus Lokiarchaeota archaeon]